MTYNCPKGCKSSDPEFCSECGTPLKGGVTMPTEISYGSVINPTTGEICPDCGTPREPGGRFCEVCRYDFDKQASNSMTIEPPVVPQITLKPQIPLPPVAPPPPRTVLTTPFVGNARLNVIIQVDPSLMTPEVEEPCPVGVPDKIFPLDLEENLIGRRSESKQIYPEIEVNDPGVSRRHVKLIRQSQGGFAALELGSANGTRLNGAVLEPGVLTPIQAGDELVMGNWTRLKIVGR